MTIFNDTFIGKEVEIVTNFAQKTHHESEEGSYIEEGPIVFRGFLVGVDEDHYLLGETLDKVTDWIPKSACLKGGLSRQEESGANLDDIFDNMPTGGGLN